MEMLKIEKTLQSVRELLDMLRKEGVEFTLGEPNDDDCVANIRTTQEGWRIFLSCAIRPDSTFCCRYYDRPGEICDFEGFRERITRLASRKCRDKAVDKRRAWVMLCDGADVPMPDSLAAVVSGLEDASRHLGQWNFDNFCVSHGKASNIRVINQTTEREKE